MLTDILISIAFSVGSVVLLALTMMLARAVWPKNAGHCWERRGASDHD